MWAEIKEGCWQFVGSHSEAQSEFWKQKSYGEAVTMSVADSVTNGVRDYKVDMPQGFQPR